MAQNSTKKTEAPLLPDRHPQLELFICNRVDVNSKGDIGSMEHPVFALSAKAKEPRRVYNNNGVHLEVVPSSAGYATVFDRDVLLYAISHCVFCSDHGKSISRKIRFHVFDFLKATNRSLGGESYVKVKDMLTRMQGTQITTNIKQGGKEYFDVFSLLDSARIVKEDGKIQEIEIVLPQWIMDAIESKNILTFDKDYFRLRKPLERRLYEIARKHCGDGVYWNKKGGYYDLKVFRMNLGTLQQKCGSNSTLKEFVRSLREIINQDEIHDYFPEYKLKLIERKTKEKLTGLDKIQVAISIKNTDRFQRKSNSVIEHETVGSLEDSASNQGNEPISSIKLSAASIGLLQARFPALDMDSMQEKFNTRLKGKPLKDSEEVHVAFLEFLKTQIVHKDE